MVCDELSAAFKNMTSQVVSNATYMVNYLARGGVEVLTMRMAQK
jgi:glycine/serine hydroxymethyltransferase